MSKLKCLDIKNKFGGIDEEIHQTIQINLEVKKMIKKINVLFVLALFLMSMIPVTFAESDSIQGNQGEITQVQEITIREKTGEINNNTDNSMKDTEESDLEEDNSIKAQTYQESKEKYMDSREAMIQSRTQAKECTENCDQFQQRYRTNTQAHLMNLAEVVLKNLERLQEKVRSSNIEQSKKESLLANIEARNQELKETQRKLENKENVSEEEIRIAVTGIKESWKEARPLLKIGVGELTQAKLGNTLMQVEQLKTKFEGIQTKLSENGQDTTQLEEYLDNLETSLGTAQQEWEKAREEFAQAKESKNAEQIRVAHQHQVKSREELVNIREQLRNMVQEIRELNKPTEEPVVEE